MGEGPNCASLHSRWPCRALGKAHWELHHYHCEGFGGLYLSPYWNCDWHDEKYRSSTRGRIEPLCRWSSITAAAPCFLSFSAPFYRHCPEKLKGCLCSASLSHMPFHWLVNNLAYLQSHCERLILMITGILPTIVVFILHGPEPLQGLRQLGRVLLPSVCNMEDLWQWLCSRVYVEQF